MNDKHQRLRDDLGHILQAVERIERYTAAMTETVFLREENELTQDAVIRNFEIIGEASRNIERHCPEFAAAHPELPLLNAYEMRNALAHGYFRVDLEILWNTIQHALPTLHQGIVELLME
jgi:uncharacterized protein with HEPN domain